MTVGDDGGGVSTTFAHGQPVSGVHPFLASCSALAFGSVHQLLRAGEFLKEKGFDVLVAPRRIQGCGVLLLVEERSAAAVLSMLAEQGIRPSQVLNYSSAEHKVSEQDAVGSDSGGK